MTPVLIDIEAGKLTEECAWCGIPARQRLRVVVESLDDDSIPITAINSPGNAFDWIVEEPDL